MAKGSIKVGDEVAITASPLGLVINAPLVV